MKSSSVLAILLVLFAGIWGETAAQAFLPGQLTLSPAVGLRTPGAINVSSQAGTYSVPFLMYVDYGVEDFLSMGPWIGYRYFSCTNCALEPGGNFSAGVRFNGHILPILKRFGDVEVDLSKFDPYVSLLGGYEWRSGIWRVPRAALGVRYYANPRVAFFGEVGSGAFTIFVAGCSFRMN